MLQLNFSKEIAKLLHPNDPEMCELELCDKLRQALQTKNVNELHRCTSCFQCNWPDNVCKLYHKMAQYFMYYFTSEDRPDDSNFAAVFCQYYRINPHKELFENAELFD